MSYLVSIVAITLVIAAFVLFTKISDASRSEELAARRKRLVATKEKNAAAEARARYLQDLLIQSRALTLEVIEAYRQSLAHLEEAEAWLNEAAKHQRSRAFSPFWEACERVLEALGRHRSQIDAATRLIHQLRAVNDTVVAAQPNLADQVGAVPQDVGAAQAIAAGVKVASRVEAVAYTAQSDFEFATIYEQRRTTAAVIAGFQGLHGALRGMAAAINASYSGLAESLSASAQEFGRVAASMEHGAGFAAGHDSLGGQVRQMNEHLAEIARRH